MLGKKESLEATLGALRRQEMLLDEELRHLKQELITCDSKVAAGVEELGAYTIILEKLNMTKALIETKRNDIEEKMVKHGEAIIAAEKETKLGKLLERAQRTRTSVEAEIAAKVATHGSVDEIKEKIEERRQARQKQEEEHWYLEDENQLLLQVLYVGQHVKQYCVRSGDTRAAWHCEQVGDRGKDEREQGPGSGECINVFPRVF